MNNQNDIIILKMEEYTMSDNIEIKNINGVDIVQYKPMGVCCKMMQIRIKDDVIQDIEFAGGCNGNLSGISILTKGMNINDVIPKLSGLPCGSRPTSCPDQLTKGLEAYIQAKNGVVAQ